MIGLIGASGFIGRSFIEHCALREIPLRTYARGQLSGIAQSRIFEHHILELNLPYDSSIFEGLETVVLAVSATRPNTPENTPSNEISRNVVPHLRLFEKLKQAGVPHIIYLSSGGSIYGEPSVKKPIGEDSPRRPCDAYGFGKMAIESAIETSWTGDGRRFTIIRPSNPVGVHQLRTVGAHGLFGTVLHHVQMGYPIRIQGDGNVIRDYFAVEDLAKLIENAATSMVPKESVVVNASSAHGLTINDVIDICSSAVNREPLVEYDRSHVPTITYNVLKNSRARQIFRWEPQKTIADIVAGLKSAIQKP